MVLANIKALGLTRFIRVKEEIDKEALLREPETARSIEGVAITRHEEFCVKSAEVGVEVTSRVSKLKRVTGETS